MCNGILLLFKSYLYQIYTYTISHPSRIVIGLMIWFMLCSTMEWREKSVKRRSVLSTVWKGIIGIILIGCIFLLLYVTLGNRTQSVDMKYKWVIFWSYREVIFHHNQFILWQIVWNILGFVPIGNALYYLLGEKRKLYKVVFSCGIFSAGIELIQLFFRIGLFEFDDIFHNTLGVIIGYMIAEMGRRFLASVSGK